MLKRSQIFVFSISLVATVFVGFFVWSAFVDFPGNVVKKVLGQVDKLGSNIFTASILPTSKIENIVPTTDSAPVDIIGQDSPPLDESFADSLETSSQTTIVAVDQEKQDIIDNITEQIDIIKQKISLLTQDNDIKKDDTQKEDIQKDKPDENKDIQKKQDIQDNQDNQDNQVNNQNQSAVSSKSLTTYPEILISEVQIMPMGQRSIELYNPNNEQISLTDWYIQRKDVNDNAWASLISSTKFVNKIIPGKGYFLISRELVNSDILFDFTLSNDNSLVLKNPNGEISDKLGFGNAKDPESLATQNPGAGQSIGRKVLSDGTEEDTDNNLNDFELQTPTPKAPNIAYIEPLITGGGGGAGSDVSAPVVYPKILISEVKIAEKNGDKNVFIELYNPGDAEVDLTNWYLFRNRTSFITKTLFANKKIPAKDYLLITKNDSAWADKADILFDGTLNEDDSIVLKNLGGDADQVSWSKIPAGLSFGRKWDSETSSYADFELDSPTPKAQNITYVEPPASLDKTAPVITLIGDSEITITVGDNYADAGATASDNTDGDVTAKIITINPVDTNAPGDYTITYNVSDSSGNNAAEVSRLVHVVVAMPAPPANISPSIVTYNISNPIISPNGDGVDDSTSIDLSFSEKVSYKIYIQSGTATVKEWSGSATNPDVKVWDGTNSSGVIVPDGVYGIKVVMTDSAKNSAIDTSKTITIDNTAPVITLNGDAVINLKIGDTYQEFGAIVADQNIAETGALEIGGDTVNTAQEGNYTITYDAIDTVGNKAAQVVRSVVVINPEDSPVHDNTLTN